MKSTSLFEKYQQDVNVNDISKYQKHKYVGCDSLDIKIMSCYVFQL